MDFFPRILNFSGSKKVSGYAIIKAENKFPKAIIIPFPPA
jgi:hypothetical protein